MTTLLTKEVLQAAYPLLLVGPDASPVELDLTKELRQQSFPYLLHILRNPAPNLISFVPHRSQNPTHHSHAHHSHHTSSSESGSGDAGYLYLFDNKTPHYLEDDIQWAAKRMNIKLVLYNTSKNTYKLKNHKEDVGECVMRRQTWSGVSDVVVWRRSEYKLMNKIKVNGREELIVQDFPVLIHYFTQNNIVVNVADPVVASDNIAHSTPTPLLGIALKVEENPELEDTVYATSSSHSLSITPTSSSHNLSSSLTSTSHLVDQKRKAVDAFSDPPGELIQNFWDDHIDPNAVPMSPSQLLNIFSQNEQLNSTMENIKVPPATHYSFPPPFQPKILYPQLDNSQPTAEIRTYAPDTGPVQEPTKILVCVHGFSFFDQYLFPNTSSSSSSTSAASSAAPQTSPQNVPAQKGAKSRKKSVNASPSAHSTLSAVSNNTVYYYSFWCVFDFGTEVPATPIAPGVVEVQAPPRMEPGPVKFWLVYKENSSKKIMQISNQALFHYLPTNDCGKVSVCIQRVVPTTCTVEELAVKYKYTAKEIDLSHNNLFGVQFLVGFLQLTTLILDYNSLTSQTTFPHMPSITTLSLAYNSIRTLESFILNLSWSFPNLVRLNLEGNEAAPSRVKPHFHYNYRIYCISKLKKLTTLDSYDVTIEEKQHASWIANEEK